MWTFYGLQILYLNYIMIDYFYPFSNVKNVKEIHILKATSSLLVYTYYVFCLLKIYIQFEKKKTFLRQKGGRINSYSNGYFYVINTINKPACHGNITLSNLICNSHIEVSLVENPITLLC